MSDRYTNNDLPPCRVFRRLELGETLVLGCDPAEVNDFCALAAFSKKHNDFPIIYNSIIESTQFGHEIYNISTYIKNKTEIWPVLQLKEILVLGLSMF